MITAVGWNILTYRFLESSLLTGRGRSPWSFSVAPNRYAGPGFFRALVPSQDLLPAGGLSKTRKDGAGAFWTSSNALPEDFRRINDLGILMGIGLYRRGLTRGHC